MYYSCCIFESADDVSACVDASGYGVQGARNINLCEGVIFT